MDEVMYPTDFEEEKDDNDEVDDGGTEEEGAKKKKMKLSKGTKPREIMDNGPLFRVILFTFLQELRPLMVQLGLNPATAVELGTAGFLHEAIYNKLTSVYNGATGPRMHSTEGPAHRLVPTKQIQNLCLCTPLNFLPAKASQNMWIGTDSPLGEGPFSPVMSSPTSPPYQSHSLPGLENGCAGQSRSPCNRERCVCRTHSPATLQP
jgi:hypothetical protein